MKQIMLAIFTCMLLANSAFAQVKLNLRYHEDTKVYTVSMLPEVTWAAPQNMLASAQVVLAVPAGSDFTPAITSMVDGLVWADNAYIENPAGALGKTFVCIALVNGPTSKIELANGKEVPLFSFVNAGGNCAGLVELLPNDDARVQAVRGSGLNVTQYLAVLGARGNAFAGVDGEGVDCSSASTGIGQLTEKLVDNVLISPVPADESLTIQWTLLSDRNVYKQIVICDAQGREVLREKISDGLGAHTLHLNVGNWAAGLYRVRFAFGSGHQTQAWNLMVVH
jgi:hypothetical protein